MMHWFGILAVSLGATATASASSCHLETLKCNAADRCLQAIRATDSPSRAEDCSSYLLTTVTPSPVTITVTNTHTISLISTEDVIQTNTIHDTTTAIDLFTASADLPVITQTVKSVNPALRRRGQSASLLSGIPPYASPCRSAARYSSACSCLGATNSTVVLPPSTVTSYASQTVSVLGTETRTTATETQTIFDLTTTVTNTVATLTNTVASTTTVIQEVPLSAGFAIRITRTYPSELFLGYANPMAGINGIEPGPTPYKFWLDSEGRLTSASGFAGVGKISDFTLWNISPLSDPTWQPHKPIINPTTLELSGWETTAGPYLDPYYAPPQRDYSRMRWVFPQVPPSAPRSVGWVDVVFHVEAFLD